MLTQMHAIRCSKNEYFQIFWKCENVRTCKYKRIVRAVIVNVSERRVYFKLVCLLFVWMWILCTSHRIGVHLFRTVLTTRFGSVQLLMFAVCRWVFQLLCVFFCSKRSGLHSEPQIVPTVHIINNRIEWLSFKLPLDILSAAYARFHHQCFEWQKIGQFWNHKPYRLEMHKNSCVADFSRRNHAYLHFKMEQFKTGKTHECFGQIEFIECTWANCFSKAYANFQ